jgi:hypothetical protein
MLRILFFKEQFFLIILIATMHILAMELYWYWQFLWLDILMHFLGGLWVALASFWILGIFKNHTSYIQSKKQAIIFALVSALFIGVLWEVFEYISDIAVTSEAYWPDTTLDLIMDSLGGVLAGLYAWKVLLLKKTESFISVKAKITIGTYEQ